MDICGDTVRQLRQERGWTQDRLAEMTDLSVRTIQRVEKSGLCDMETRCALASVFKVRLSDLEAQSGKVELAQPAITGPMLSFKRLMNGQDVVDVFDGADWYRFSSDPTQGDGDAQYAENFDHTIRAYAEIWRDLERSDKARAVLEIQDILKECETKGFALFGVRTKEKMPVRTFHVQTGRPVTIRVCNFRITYAATTEIREGTR